MKRLAALAVASVAAAVLAAGAGASAGGVSCGGKLVVNVHYTLVNDYDSAVGGGAWANDAIDRHLQIWAVDEGTYCAVVEDRGSFTTFAGASPGGTGTVGEGITGRIDGGYETIDFVGTLDASPAYATRGQLGTYDLACTGADTCPGERPSFLSYFSGTPAWSFASWGWTYHTAQNGTWVNASTGNSGDITS